MRTSFVDKPKIESRNLEKRESLVSRLIYRFSVSSCFVSFSGAALTHFWIVNLGLILGECHRSCKPRSTDHQIEVLRNLLKKVPSCFVVSSTATLCPIFLSIQSSSSILLEQIGKALSQPQFGLKVSFLARFVQYKQTSLEKTYKHDLLTEQDLGVTIDLINPETYEVADSNLRLTEEDEKLLEDEVAAPQDTKRSRCHNRSITWLKKTEYISTEFNRYGASSDKTETKYVFSLAQSSLLIIIF